MTSQRQIQNYGEASLPLTDTLQDANNHWTRSGTTGVASLATMNFGTAKTEMSLALAGYKRAQNACRSIFPGPDVRHAHNLLTQCIQEYVRAASLALEGIDEIDGEKINRAADQYGRASDLAVQSAGELTRATQAIDRP